MALHIHTPDCYDNGPIDADDYDDDGWWFGDEYFDDEEWEEWPESD